MVGNDIVLNLDRSLLADIMFTGMEIGAIFAPPGNVPQSLDPPATQKAEGRKSSKTSPRKGRSKQMKTKPPTHGKISPVFVQEGDEKVPEKADSRQHHRHHSEHHHKHHPSALHRMGAI